MARFDRCSICDYTEADGSSLSGVPPGANGKVRMVGNDTLCQVCSTEIDIAVFTFRPPEETDEELLMLEE